MPVFFGRGVRGARNTHNLAALRRLNLSNNHLSELPPGLPGLDRVETLFLHRNYVGELPKTIGA